MDPPKNEIIWAQYKFNGKTAYAITSTALRDVYFLCEVKDGKLVKTKHKAQKPTELEKFIYK